MMSVLMKSAIGRVARLAGGAMLVAAGCIASWIGSACAPSSGMRYSTEDNYERNYQRALELYEKHEYRRALAAFSSLYDKNPGHLLADNVLYWQGECYYALEDYAQAMGAFEKVFNLVQSNKRDAALLKLGLCWYHKKVYRKASCCFRQLLDDWPTSQWREKARDYHERCGRLPCS